MRAMYSKSWYRFWCMCMQVDKAYACLLGVERRVGRRVIHLDATTLLLLAVGHG